MTPKQFFKNVCFYLKTTDRPKIVIFRSVDSVAEAVRHESVGVESILDLSQKKRGREFRRIQRKQGSTKDFS